MLILFIVSKVLQCVERGKGAVREGKKREGGLGIKRELLSLLHLHYSRTQIDLQSDQFYGTSQSSCQYNLASCSHPLPVGAIL